MNSFVATIPTTAIAEFCRRWRILDLAVFGSVLRSDFGPDSDVDVLVTFAADANWSLLDHVRMQHELKAILQRPVDLISNSALERSANWLLRREVLSTSQVIYSQRIADVAR
jgi:predicted nucleotidyltransferase